MWSPPSAAPAAHATLPVAVSPPGWYPDPWYPGAVRWWDGEAWTTHAAYPAGTAPPREPFVPLPQAAAWWALVVTAASLVGARVVLEFLGRFDWPILVYAVLVAVLGYGPMVAFCWYACRRWGTGSLRDDLGFRVRWSDLGWGPVIWLAAWAAGIAAVLVVFVTRLPITSNTEGIDDYSGDRGVLIAFLIVAVVAAPFVEELLFRGVVLRGFASMLTPWMAVGAQGLCFGLAHSDPVRGVGNVGLVIVLGSVGAAFGGAAYLLRRIGPTIIAHALYNGVVLLIVLVAG